MTRLQSWQSEMRRGSGFKLRNFHANVTPGWHPKTQKVIAVGAMVRYLPQGTQGVLVVKLYSGV